MNTMSAPLSTSSISSRWSSAAWRPISGSEPAPRPRVMLAADVELHVGVAHEQRLRVGVHRDELDALQARVDHPVDGVAAAAADADDLDHREVVLRLAQHAVASFARPWTRPPHCGGGLPSTWYFGPDLTRHNPEPPVEVESYVKLYFRCRLYSRNIRAVNYLTRHIRRTRPTTRQPATGLVGHAHVDVARPASPSSASSTASAARTFAATCGRLAPAGSRDR